MTLATFARLHNADKNNAYAARIRYVKIIAKALAISCIILSFISFAGYFLQIPQLYRPIADGAATHPLTAICVVFVSTSIFFQHKKHFPKLVAVLAVLAFLITLLVILDSIINTHFALFITPFLSTLTAEQNSNLSNSMGVNTAIMLACLAIALIFGNNGRSVLSQLFSFIAMAVPMLSIIGYAYDIDGFFGNMSILTTTYGIFLSISALCIYAQSGAVRALLSPHIGGTIARFQVVLGYFVPITIGYLFIQSLVSAQVEDLFGLYVVIISWFIIILIISSAIIQEKSDKKRRIAELALLNAARHDSLTGIPNRRWYLDLANEVLINTKQSKTNTFLLMLDIDHFKAVNDQAGHIIGDKVLIAIADALQKNVRNTDIICRLGGEEFSALLPNSDLESALFVAEKIRAEIEKTYIEGYTAEFGKVTTSIGLTQIKESDSIDDIISRADSALYLAKEKGRNKIVSYEATH
jgi:diguanylate cyclase (GGDEF)-like protein